MDVPRYCLTKTDCCSDDNLEYTTYGISCSMRGLELDCISDVSCNQKIVECMINLFNECQLSLDRFRCAVIHLLP